MLRQRAYRPARALARQQSGTARRETRSLATPPPGLVDGGRDQDEKAAGQTRTRRKLVKWSCPRAVRIKQSFAWLCLELRSFWARRKQRKQETTSSVEKRVKRSVLQPLPPLSLKVQGNVGMDGMDDMDDMDGPTHSILANGAKDGAKQSSQHRPPSIHTRNEAIVALQSHTKRTETIQEPPL